jgi:hypothetical protein
MRRWTRRRGLRRRRISLSLEGKFGEGGQQRFLEVVVFVDDDKGIIWIPERFVTDTLVASGVDKRSWVLF